MSEPARSITQGRTLGEVCALIGRAEAAGLVRTAMKTKPVDARPAKRGDAIVQAPENPGDTYLVAAASFACTYEIVV